MKISVITVAYNAATTIADTLRSVAAQDYPHVEHLIIDGASTDNTAALVAAHGRPGSIFHSAPDDGLYDAMNKGIAAATGDIIGFLNADEKAQGRPVGVVNDHQGGLLVADDVGNKIWRVTAAK